MSQPRRTAVFDTVLREIVRETDDTVTLILDPGDHPRDYLAGQFVSIEAHQFPELGQQLAYFEKAKGRKELSRSYSMASTPDEPYLAITVKEEVFIDGATAYPPLLSPLLVHGMWVGRKITVRGYSGFYHLPEDVQSKTDHVVHVVAGSGVVPNYAMVKWSLAHLPDLRHTFVYSNKTWDEVIFAGALAEMERSSGGRLRVLHCLTREPTAPADSPCAKLGRINREILEEAIPDPKSCLVFACGPGITRWDKLAARARGEEAAPRFLETVRGILAEMEVDRKQIHTEAYG